MKAKVLLVEDNRMSQILISRRLTIRDYDIVIAVNGQEGVDKVHSEKPDLVLMDLSLPVLDGWEAIRRLKADEVTRGIPIIALTAHAMAEEREKTLRAGADDYDTKPVDFDRLLGKIEKILGGVTVQIATKTPRHKG